MCVYVFTTCMHNYVHVCICLFAYQSYVICIFNQYGTRSNITDLRSPVSYQAMNNSTYVYLTCWVFLPFRMVNNSTYVQYTIDGDIDLTCISIYRMYLIWRGLSQAFLTNNIWDIIAPVLIDIKLNSNARLFHDGNRHINQ